MINVEDKRIAHNEANKRYREKKLKEHPYKKCSRCGIEKPIEDLHRYRMLGGVKSERCIRTKRLS